jgi:hypothetical protein
MKVLFSIPMARHGATCNPAARSLLAARCKMRRSLHRFLCILAMCQLGTNAGCSSGQMVSQSQGAGPPQYAFQICRGASDADEVGAIMRVELIPRSWMAGSIMPARIIVTNEKSTDLVFADPSVFTGKIHVLRPDGTQVRYTSFGKSQLSGDHAFFQNANVILPTGASIIWELDLAALFELQNNSNYTLEVSEGCGYFTKGNQWLTLEVKSLEFVTGNGYPGREHRE